MHKFSGLALLSNFTRKGKTQIFRNPRCRNVKTAVLFDQYDWIDKAVLYDLLGCWNRTVFGSRYFSGNLKTVLCGEAVSIVVMVKTLRRYIWAQLFKAWFG